MKIKFQRLCDEAVLPTKNTSTDAAFDLVTPEPITLWPNKPRLVDLGFKCEIPEGYCALIWDRSSLGSKGIHRLAGVIDAGYRGEWKVALINLTNQEVSYRAGHSVAQVVIQEVLDVEFEEVVDLEDSERGENGFGSSDSP